MVCAANGEAVACYVANQQQKGAGVPSVRVSTEGTGSYYLMKYALCDVIL